MTSKIKVDNINKVSDDSNIINKCGTNITMGQNGDTVILPNGVTEQVQSGGAIQVQSGGSITIASGATITNNGTAVGLGRTGTVDWITTPKTTGTFTAVSGEGYFCNTSGGVIIANLPAGVAGAIVSFADYAATWQTSNVTVTPNGTDKIGSVNANATLSTQGQSVTFVFVDSTQGWINTMDSTSNVRGATFMCASVSGVGNTLVTVGSCKVATFKGPGNFTVNSIADCAANNAMAYMVVAGGGGGGDGGTTESGAGAGAGGFREGRNNSITPYTASPLAAACSAITATVQAYGVVIGAGGGPSSSSPSGGNGTSTAGNISSFSTITSAGGGSGISGGATAARTPANTGGSGGGGNGRVHPASNPGNSPPVSPPQGQPGGTGAPCTPAFGGGGGGGATAAGGNASGGVAGPGGTGATTSINNSVTTYAGGGGGGTRCSGTSSGAGSGGGGAGGTGNGATPPSPMCGTINTGGGAGGTGGPNTNGGSGGSGIVIIRYKAS